MLAVIPKHRVFLRNLLRRSCFYFFVPVFYFPPPKHPLLSFSLRILRLIDRLTCRIQSPLSFLIPRVAITWLNPRCRSESPSVTIVLMPNQEPSSRISFARSRPRSNSAFPIACVDEKLRLQFEFLCSAPVAQLQTLLLVWNAIGMWVRPGSPGKQGAHDWVPGW